MMAIPALVLLTAIVIVQVAVPPDPAERRCSTDGHRRTRPPWGQPHRGRAHRADEWQRRGHRRPSARERCRRGPDFVSTGSGTWHTVAGTTPVRGTGGQAYTYTIEVEDGLQSADADQASAAAVDATLADPRSWTGCGQVTLQRVDSADPSFRISLTSQMTVRSPELCGWDIPLEASCFNKQAGRVLINDARWSRGAVAYGTDIDSYRSYAVNHEVGPRWAFPTSPARRPADRHRC